MISVSEAASELHVLPQIVSQMIFSGLIVPRFPSPGQGIKNGLDKENLYELKIALRLNNQGIKHSVIKQILNCIRRSAINWLLEGGWILICEGEIWFLTDNIRDPKNVDRVACAKSCIIINIRE